MASAFLQTHSVTLRGRNDWIADFDDATFDDFSDETSPIEERVLETFLLAGECAWPSTRITVFYATKECGPNPEVSADEPHELDVQGDDVATTIREFEAAPFEEDSVNQGHLAVALFALIETTFACSVAVAFKPLARDRFDFWNLLHRFACGGTDADCCDCSVHMLVLSF